LPTTFVMVSGGGNHKLAWRERSEGKSPPPPCRRCPVCPCSLSPSSRRLQGFLDRGHRSMCIHGSSLFDGDCLKIIRPSISATLRFRLRPISYTHSTFRRFGFRMGAQVGSPLLVRSFLSVGGLEPLLVSVHAGHTQGVAPQSATRSELDREGGDNPQPESEPRPR